MLTSPCIPARTVPQILLRTTGGNRKTRQLLGLSHSQKLQEMKLLVQQLHLAFFEGLQKRKTQPQIASSRPLKYFLPKNCCIQMTRKLSSDNANLDESKRAGGSAADTARTYFEEYILQISHSSHIICCVYVSNACLSDFLLLCMIRGEIDATATAILQACKHA